MAIKNLTVNEYRERYTPGALRQLELFAQRELDNPEVVRELEKIREALYHEEE